MSAKLFVDADACPVTRIAERVAKDYGIDCVLVCDTAHRLESSYSEVVIASKGRDCADFVLLQMFRLGDIAVTQDYGLAALCLAKGGYVLNQNGMEYTDYNIDSLLNSRHIGAKVRRAGGRLKGPAKRTAEQDSSFEKQLKELIERIS